jgi:hypothetical protein
MPESAAYPVVTQDCRRIKATASTLYLAPPNQSVAMTARMINEIFGLAYW